MDFRPFLGYKNRIMLRLLRRFFRRDEVDEDTIPEERWTADFSKPRAARFLEERGTGYAAAFRGKALELKLEKGHMLAWVENPLFRYANAVVEASFRVPAGEGSPAPYAAAGILFRYSDGGSYYALLVSNKGLFRVDAVFNGTPLPLIGWTETPEPIDLNAGVRVRIIALGDRLSFAIDDLWAGEVSDSTLSEGRVAFAAASYDETPGVAARLEHFRIDSRPMETEAAHYRWNSYIRVDPESRRRLARTFLGMDQALSALVQIKRLWRTDTKGGSNPHRSAADLLFASECALRLSLYAEAEEYLDRCVEAAGFADEGRRAVAEKAKLLYLTNRFAELREHAEAAVGLYPEDATLATLLGHAYWNLGAWERAAAAYDEARQLDPENGIVAQNAARALERSGDVEAAFSRYLDAARAFLKAEAYDDLALVLPRLRELKPGDPSVLAISGKRAYAVEDWAAAEKSLAAALAAFPKGEEDSAALYLLALLRIRAGKRKEALPLLERAAALESGFAAYRFRLAETRFLLSGDPSDAAMEADLAEALRLAPEDGWTANLAGQVALARGDLEEAARRLALAAEKLPGEEAVAVNRAELAFLRGDAEGALSLLDRDDPEGTLANAAGNLLVRLERWEEADAAYRKALGRKPDDPDYLRNRASCLVRLGLYGEADDALSRLVEIDAGPRTLDLIAYVAIKKGEYPRAEAAYRVGLERDPADPSLLAGLAWTYLSMARWKSAEETVRALEEAAGKDAPAVAELRDRLTEATTRIVSCASCDKFWRVPKDSKSAPAFRLVAEPPDHLPAGTCPSCGKTYCIECGKKHLTDGRFVCPSCSERLKLMDEGLKGLLADWAAAINLVK